MTEEIPPEGSKSVKKVESLDPESEPVNKRRSPEYEVVLTPPNVLTGKIRYHVWLVEPGSCCCGWRDVLEGGRQTHTCELHSCLLILRFTWFRCTAKEPNSWKSSPHPSRVSMIRHINNMKVICSAMHSRTVDAKHCSCSSLHILPNLHFSRALQKYIHNDVCNAYARAIISIWMKHMVVCNHFQKWV